MFTMKTCGALLVMLCIFLAEAVSDNDITDQEQHEEALTGDSVVQSAAQRSEDAATASTQQTSLRDIHTVLREMNAVIAEQRVELRYTKTQLEALESRLKASESLVEQLKHENKVNLNLALSQVEDLKREIMTRKLSFSTLLWKSGSKTLGPVSVATTLVFKNVLTNIGNAYNPNTGIFTAPVRGVYHFVMFAHGHGHASHPVVLALFKNTELIATAWSHQAAYSVNPSNGASLQLEVGDVVYVKLWANARVFDNENRHTTFSGHLLFPM